MEFEEKVETRLNNHSERIRELEIKDARDTVRIDSLCSKLEELAKTIENWMIFAQTLFWKILGATGGIIAVLAAFFFWYVQSIPR